MILSEAIDNNYGVPKDDMSIVVCKFMKKENTFIMTAEGFLEAEQELNELKNVRRPEVIKALKEARALGDLSENADYDAARNEQAIIEAFAWHEV